MRDERGPWYLLTGLALGISLGLIYAWLISPREYKDTSPVYLRANFKDQYRALIAVAYSANGNLPRARDRLERALGEPDGQRTLADQAQRILAEGGSPGEARALGLLAVALGQGALGQGSEPVSNLTPPGETPTSPPASPPPTATPSVTPSPSPQATQIPSSSFSPSPGSQAPLVTRTSQATGTPLPTRTPTSTPGLPFVLLERTFICDPKLTSPLIQVVANDAGGGPVPGVEVVVNWEGGEDHFFTGLKPELGLGYGDFTMAPGMVYSLILADGGQPVPEITAAECEKPSGGRYWGSWLLVFAQP